MTDPTPQEVILNLLSNHPNVDLYKIVAMVQLELAEGTMTDAEVLEAVTRANTVLLTADDDATAQPNAQETPMDEPTDNTPKTESDNTDNTKDVSPLEAANIEADFAEQMKLQAEMDEHSSTPVNNSVGPHVQEDTPMNETTDPTLDSSSPTLQEIIDHLGLNLIRAQYHHADGTHKSVPAGVGTVDKILVAAAKNTPEGNLFLENRLKGTAHSAECTYVSYNLVAHPNDKTQEVRPLLTLTRRAGLMGAWRPEVLLEIHEEPINRYYQNLEILFKTVNQKKENTMYSSMSQSFSSAKDRLFNPELRTSIGDRMKKVADTINHHAQSLAAKLIAKFGLIAKWTAVSMVGLWYYLIVGSAVGMGASLPLALWIGFLLVGQDCLLCLGIGTSIALGWSLLSSGVKAASAWAADVIATENPSVVTA